jgi:hypothetical protein
MGPTEFRFRLELLDLSVRRFALLTGADYRTAMAWGLIGPDGAVTVFPDWVEAKIIGLERDRVPKRAPRT